MSSTPSSPANYTISRAASPRKGVGNWRWRHGSASIVLDPRSTDLLMTAYLDPPELSDYDPPVCQEGTSQWLESSGWLKTAKISSLNCVGPSPFALPE